MKWAQLRFPWFKPRKHFIREYAVYKECAKLGGSYHSPTSLILLHTTKSLWARIAEYYKVKTWVQKTLNSDKKLSHWFLKADSFQEKTKPHTGVQGSKRMHWCPIRWKNSSLRWRRLHSWIQSRVSLHNILSEIKTYGQKWVKLDGPDNLKKWTEIGQAAFGKPITYVSKIKKQVEPGAQKRGGGMKTM